MHFTKFIELTKKDEFDWNLLGKYQLLVITDLSPLLPQITDTAFKAFKNRAHAYEDILFVFSEKKEINEELLLHFNLLDKYFEDLDTSRPYFLVLKTKDILSSGNEFIKSYIIYLDDHLEDEPEEDLQELSNADYALLDSFKFLRDYIEHRQSRLKLEKILPWLGVASNFM